MIYRLNMVFAFYNCTLLRYSAIFNAIESMDSKKSSIKSSSLNSIENIGSSNIIIKESRKMVLANVLCICPTDKFAPFRLKAYQNL